MATRKMSDKAIANKRKYDAEYIKEHYKTIHIGLPKDEANEIKKVILDNGFTLVEFMRLCVELLKEGKIKRD